MGYLEDAQPNPQTPVDDRLRPAIEQIYETANLTDALTDENARLLLDWGERELKSLVAPNAVQAQIDIVAWHIRRVMRSVNLLIEQKDSYSETKFVERLLKLVDQSMELANQKYNLNPQEEQV